MLEWKDIAIIFATLMGPVLAVQAQKWVESYKERRNRKLSVFAQLMATRSARVSPEHVQALNMLDLVFYGNRPFGILRRSKGEQSVLDAWKEYLDHLGTKPAADDNDGWERWNIRGDELLTNLLHAIAEDVDYHFDRVQLKKGAYSPIAHGDLETEQRLLRRTAIRVFAGEMPIKMQFVPPPQPLAPGQPAANTPGAP